MSFMLFMVLSLCAIDTLADYFSSRISMALTSCLHEFQTGAAAGGDMRHLIRQLHLLDALALSPPPMMLLAPLPVASATA
jgi:hypothetical protein